MARRHPASGRARGGEVIPSLRPDRARLITGAGALVSLTAVDAYVATGGQVLAVVGEGLATGGLVVLAIGLVFRFPLAIPWAVLLAGAGYVLDREHHVAVDGWACLVGAALLLAAELAAWSIGHDGRIVSERRVIGLRAATIAGLVTAAALVGFLLVGAAAVSGSAGLFVTALGVAATVAATSVILRLARG
jgi:hypothetical protein